MLVYQTNNDAMPALAFCERCLLSGTKQWGYCLAICQEGDGILVGRLHTVQPQVHLP
jgi:hypothetical protein